jgi:hypothetical protein
VKFFGDGSGISQEGIGTQNGALQATGRAHHHSGLPAKSWVYTPSIDLPFFAIMRTTQSTLERQCQLI